MTFASDDGNAAAVTAVVAGSTDDTDNTCSTYPTSRASSDNNYSINAAMINGGKMDDAAAEVDVVIKGKNSKKSNSIISNKQPPSQVTTFDGDDADISNIDTTTLTAAAIAAAAAAAAAASSSGAAVGPLHHEPSSLPSSLSRGAASSEEDSVAEMDYMSEGSNLSVKGLQPAPSAAASDLGDINDTTDVLLQQVGAGQQERAAADFVVPGLPVTPNSSGFHRYGEGGVGGGGSGTSGGSGGTVNLGRTAAAASAHPSSNSTTNSSCLRLKKGSLGGTSNNNRGTRFMSNVFASAAAAAVRGPPSSHRATKATATPAGSSFDTTPTADRKLPGAGNPEVFEGEHRPSCLPEFRNQNLCMWTASHAANSPTEDRSASLVNLLLQPLPPNFDSETQLPTLEPDYKTLIRLNLWAVIDGHGGGCVATYASEVLLPHIAASVSRALGCAIVHRGVCTVNGQLRDANALDLDGLIKTSDRSMGSRYSIQYRSPYERSDSEDDDDDDDEGGDAVAKQTAGERKQIASLVEHAKTNSTPSEDDGASILRQSESAVDGSVSSAKTSVKTTASPANREALLGTHSPQEVAAITRAITESFLAVDEGWINSIDPVATHQTSCQSNGRWNSGACALVVFTIQRLDWNSVSEPDREKESRDLEKSRRNTSQNRDAARRRMLDYATRTKSASSMSTVSSTSSLTTEEAVNASGLESEITETEGEDDRMNVADVRKRNPYGASSRSSEFHDESLISPPGGCSCHCYRAHDAILYTAHVGDCRAVMLGSAPPRTIKVRDVNHPDTTDDESSHHSSDETECLSSSDHDADSSEEEDVEMVEGSMASAATTTAATSSYMNFPRRVVRQRASRRLANDDSGPFQPLPPLESKEESAKRVEFDFDTDTAGRERRLNSSAKDPSDSSTSSQDSDDLLPLVHLPPVTRPIDLTTDHSAYNPAEVTAVLRRCNNAPRAISAGVGGGILRVAGSLAVTRALGDAYLKTPRLSFLPYKSHAPYITARPEVNCRPLVKEHDKVLVLATDGVWERAGGEDVLRWVRNFYEERIAEAGRRSNRRLNQVEKSADKDKDVSNEEADATGNNSQEGAERDLFERNDGNETTAAARKREAENGSPSPPTKRRKRSRQSRISYNVADVIVRRVLNKVRRARNISSLQALMSLPQGRARRSKHDDITSSVVDLSAFVS